MTKRAENPTEKPRNGVGYEIPGWIYNDLDGKWYAPAKPPKPSYVRPADAKFRAFNDIGLNKKDQQ